MAAFVHAALFLLARPCMYLPQVLCSQQTYLRRQRPGLFCSQGVNAQCLGALPTCNARCKFCRLHDRSARSFCQLHLEILSTPGSAAEAAISSGGPVQVSAAWFQEAGLPWLPSTLACLFSRPYEGDIPTFAVLCCRGRKVLP